MLDGAIEPKAIPKAATERNFPAIAITDRNGLYGSMPFADACKSAGVQPILGTMLGVARPQGQGGPVGQPVLDWLALYAQDAKGYDNLCELVSAAHLDRPLELEPHVDFEFLAAHAYGLIALTAAGEGGLTRLLAEGQGDAARAYLDRLTAIFPDRLYLELARRGDAAEIAAEDALIDLAYDTGLPLVATNPAQYAGPEFHAAHDAMLCIANGSFVDHQDRIKGSPESWIKSGPMMQELFADLPEALANTLVVAQRCTAMPPKRKPILPSLAGDLEGEARQLRDDAHAGLEMRLVSYADLDDAKRQVYVDRLNFEIDVIVNMGFPGYFLIVADFIKWAKGQNIPVGPGRGSGAGSVVAWALTITDLDPIELGLLFERFLNPERVSMPDFDIDFCETRRGEVIRYVQQKYGRDHVAQIITFGKLKARAVLRDTGRILQMPYGQVDRLCKLVPNHPTDPWDLKRALSGVPELKREASRDKDVRRLLDLAMQLEGLPRNSSTHAAGVVIGDRPLAQLVPLYRDPRSDMPVTQFDMKYVETAGLVKFDFLGLKTLSVLHKAVEMLALRGIEIDLSALALDDPAVFDLLQAGDTVGVFQLESEGMRRTLAAVKPTNFGDIIALVSLYRPGPMDNIPSFGARKNGREVIVYPHPLLEGILKETYGVIVYQEQVMQAAQVLAGYSLGDADLLRRAMGKKVQAEMDQQRGRFVEGAAANNIDATKANELFDLIDKFAGYGFNKSHAAAYALLAYQTAWMKTHYPHEFYAASMCYDMHQSEKLSIFVDDCRRAGIVLHGPSVNHSEAEFCVEQDEDGLAVRYALAGLKNVGERAMEQVVEERRRNGPFAGIDDFANRIDPTLINRRQLESLASAGGFDDFCDDRRAVHAAVETILGVAQSAQQGRISGQAALFGEETGSGQAIRLDMTKPWSTAERMAAEKDAFGFFFSDHPVGQYRQIANANGALTYAQVMASAVDMAPDTRRPAVLAVLVESVQRRKTKRGKDFIMADMSDASGQFSASCFEEKLVEPFLQWASDAACVLLNVELDKSTAEQPPRLTIRSGQPLEGLTQSLPMMLEMDVAEPQALAELALLLPRKAEAKGEVRVKLHLANGEQPVLRLGKDFALDAALAERIMPMAGISNVILGAKRPHLRVVN